MISTLLGVAVISPASALDFSGNVAAQGRWFPDGGLDERQSSSALSISTLPEWYWEWADGDQSFDLILFARWDQRDDQRSHLDIREARWLKVDGSSEWVLGIDKVFWGVTESVHLVDIINQTDLVENPDGEQKLGQPMVHYSTRQEWGTLDLFALPWFRERTYPGARGRLRSSPRVDTNKASYESGAERHHVDLAARWSQFYGDWDFGVAAFHGTSREPDLAPVFSNNGKLVLAPYYPIITQFSLDLQATKGDWLWKLEALYREGQGQDDYFAAVGGFEYTLVGIGDTDLDLGMLLEYQYDARPLSRAGIFQDDLFAGLRLTFNDAQSTAILAGVIVDRNTHSSLFNLEATRRLGDSYRLQVQARLWANPDPGDPVYGFRDEDYLEVELARYF